VHATFCDSLGGAALKLIFSAIFVSLLYGGSLSWASDYSEGTITPVEAKQKERSDRIKKKEKMQAQRHAVQKSNKQHNRKTHLPKAGNQSEGYIYTDAGHPLKVHGKNKETRLPPP